MPKKTTRIDKPKMVSWLFSAPAKFALMSFGLTIGVIVAYALIMGLLFKSPQFNPMVVAILAAVTFVYSICRLIKWLPRENLDRRSFIAIDNGLTFLYLFIIVASALFLAGTFTRVEYLLMYLLFLQSYSLVLFWLATFVGSVIYLYAVGLMITSIYAIYRRAMAIGVPRWKAVLSIPFTFVAFRFPAYLLPPEKKEKQVITIKSNWYSRFTDWVIARPINTVFMFFATMLMTVLFLDGLALCLMLIFGGIFGIWVWIAGVRNFRKNIGGTFSSITAAFNIAMIIVLVGFMAFAPRVSPDAQIQIQHETVQVTETFGG